MTQARPIPRPGAGNPQAETTVRSLPWSTRAVILVAFAIQFGSVGAGITASACASPHDFMLCDSGLFPMLWGDHAAPPGPDLHIGPVSAVRADGPVRPSTTAAGSGWVRSIVAESFERLPIPPPTA